MVLVYLLVISLLQLRRLLRAALWSLCRRPGRQTHGLNGGIVENSSIEVVLLSVREFNLINMCDLECFYHHRKDF